VRQTYHAVTSAVWLDASAIEIVERAAKRFEKLNGIPVQILYNHTLGGKILTHRRFVKSLIWEYVPEDVERVIYYDYDVLPLTPLGELPKVDFAAAPDLKKSMDEAFEIWPLLRQYNIYFSPSVFLAHRKMAELFDRIACSQAAKPDQRGSYEQSLFNTLIQYKRAIHQLPKSWNYIVGCEAEYVPEPKMLNCAGIESSMLTMRVLLDILEAKEDPLAVASSLANAQEIVERLQRGIKAGDQKHAVSG